VLKVVLQHHENLLIDLQQMFEIADTENTGWLTYDELVDMYRRQLWRLRVNTETGTLTCDAELSTKEPEVLATDIMQAMDLDADGQISYADFMAFCLGRRRQEVLLHVYDLSNGSMPSVSPWLLGERIDGIWHCGIVVFGKEYYFGGELVYDTPGKTCFGQPVKTISLGFTLWRKDELHAYIVTEMKPIFSRETYDVIRNNCNHFANKVCLWLTGQSIPKDVGQQAEELMRYPATRTLIPILNRWLGNKYLEAKAIEKERSPSPSRCNDETRSGTRGTPQPEMCKGMIVGIKPANGDGPPVLGTISGPAAPHHSPGERNLHKEKGSLASSNSMPNLAAATSTDSCWVTYFGPPTLSARGSRGKVCTELLPQARISMVALEDTGSEGLYQNALEAMTGVRDFDELVKSLEKSATRQRCRGSASCGLSPMTTMVPGSMQDDIQLESPRILESLQESKTSKTPRQPTTPRSENYYSEGRHVSL
jgi:hypothetical protein